MAGANVRRWAAMAAVAIALLVPASAGASERVLDGSFDLVTGCTPADCTSPVWSESRTGGVVGPLCEVGTGSCGFFEGPTLNALSPPKWAQFGGETIPGNATYAIEQVVNIPAGPASLSFQLLIRDSNVSTGAFTVQIGGTPVYAAGGGTPGHAAYAPVTVDVSAFSGGLREVKFENLNTAIPPGGSSDSFNVDNVSLVDSPPPTTTPAPPVTPAPAVKKCRKGKKLKKGRCVKKKRRKKR